MTEGFTPGANRALSRAQARALRRGAEHVEPVDLLAALVDEEESRASVVLGRFGLSPEQVWDALGVSFLGLSEEELASVASPGLPHSPALRSVLGDASLRARGLDRARAVGTEHLLAGLVAGVGPSADLLVGVGLVEEVVAAELQAEAAGDVGPIPMAEEIPPLDLGEPCQEIDLARIVDASANRASEGLRVVEDYARFVLDDPGLTRRLKETRHRLGQALRALDPDLLLDARDTRGDVGTHIMTASERARENVRAILTANFKRAGEAIRSLEEYSKLVDVWLAGRFEVLRYDVYTLEKLVLTAAAGARVIGDARLMVLVGGLPTMGDLSWVVGEALAGGADAIQLREKHLPDREWLSRAREARILTARAKALFIVNDRPDLARLASADAVHLGQDDLAPRDARRVVGARMTIGVSTHEPAQLDAAVLAGAGYLGVGPVFESETKAFDDFAGLAYVSHAATATNLPWFAIGGIHESNLDDVLDAGARRIAVSSAIVRADSPRAAAAALRSRLDEAWGHG